MAELQVVKDVSFVVVVAMAMVEVLAVVAHIQAIITGKFHVSDGQMTSQYLRRDL